MQSTTQIFIPEDLAKKRNRILDYYKGIYDFNRCKDFIYGGMDLTNLFEQISFNLVDSTDLLVNIELSGKHSKPLIIKNLSFRQLTVESSNNFLDNPVKGWENITIQQRVEICQNELSRWSVILKSNGVKHDEIEIINDDEFSKIELINNCTTSKGFELKVKMHNNLYHGSFKMPPNIYDILCLEQAGSEAKQGWNVDWDRNDQSEDANHGLINPKIYPEPLNNPTFGQIYWESEHHSRESIQIDLDNYRNRLELISEGDIDINLGGINYNRWDAALGKNNEYYSKPMIRKLIGHKSKSQFIDPPSNYSEIYTGDYKFRLPLFLENGLYDVTSLKEKSHYSIMSNFSSFEIWKLDNDLLEIILINNSSQKDELNKIVFGNIRLEEIPNYPNILTIDRFCFAPRSTVSFYEKSWKPSSITLKRETKYSFLLSTNGSFIQPESWGLERAILSVENNRIVIDLMSYERILPIWQGKFDIGPVQNT